MSKKTDDIQKPPALVVALVGDSDISRWPKDLLPDEEQNVSICVKGESGATLSETLPLLTSVLETVGETAESLVIVFCAGENDISQGTRLDETLISFRQVLEKVFPPTAATASNTLIHQKRHLVVLGPKFEPWLEYDASARKQYVKMSHSMARACQKFELPSSTNHKISFVDCLTMFCGDSGQQPGALLGGKAIPEKKYFDYDLLHLSKEGYAVWKEVIDSFMSPYLQCTID